MVSDIVEQTSSEPTISKSNGLDPPEPKADIPINPQDAKNAGETLDLRINIPFTESKIAVQVVSSQNSEPTQNKPAETNGDISLGIQNLSNIFTGGISLYPPPAPPVEESSEDEEIVPMLATRSRRGNAGAKMAALISKIADLEEEEMFAEVADDQDFTFKEEKDEFDSDFGSTSESGEDEDEGEKAIREEEKEERRAKRAKQPQFSPFVKSVKKRKEPKLIKSVFKAQSSTPAPDGETTTEGDEPPKKKRKVSFAPAGEGEEDILEAIEWEDVRRVKSTRTAALKYINEVEERAQKDKERLEKIQARINKNKANKQATKQKTLTQADLIAQALEIEDLNKASLEEFYTREDERRELERRKNKRKEVEGSRIVWRSYIDSTKEVKGVEEVKGPRLKNLSTPAAPLSGTQSGVGWSRNVLILRDFTGSKSQEMTAIFGDHCDWAGAGKSNLNRGRAAPPPRKALVCAITGTPARYKDPLTGLPYSSMKAFKTIRALINHQFAWDPDLNSFTGRFGEGLLDQVQPPPIQEPPPDYYLSHGEEGPEVQEQDIAGNNAKEDDKSKKRKEPIPRKRSRPKVSSSKDSARKKKKTEEVTQGPLVPPSTPSVSLVLSTQPALKNPTISTELVIVTPSPTHPSQQPTSVTDPNPVVPETPVIDGS